MPATKTTAGPGDKGKRIRSASRSWILNPQACVGLRAGETLLTDKDHVDLCSGHAGGRIKRAFGGAVEDERG